MAKQVVALTAASGPQGFRVGLSRRTIALTLQSFEGLGSRAAYFERFGWSKLFLCDPVRSLD